MDNILRNFYNNPTQRDAVRTFQIDMLGEMAKDLAFRGKDTAGIAEAKMAIEKSFDKLEELYAAKEKPVSVNTR